MVEQMLTQQVLLHINQSQEQMQVYIIQTYTKVVDDRSINNIDPVRNKIDIRHVSGTNYTDVLVTCLLDYGEPSGQDAFDTAL